MPENAAEQTSKRSLEPLERISEEHLGLLLVLGGLAMVGITIALGG